MAIVVGDMFHPIPIRVQAQPHDAEDHDLPEMQAGATGGFLVREHDRFDQGQHLGLEGGVTPEPLEAGEDRRKFIATVERQANLLDGRELQIGPDLKTMAHRGER